MRLLPPLLHLLLWVWIASGTVTPSSDTSTVEVVVPPSQYSGDLMENCSRRTVRVQFYSWTAGGIEYRRRTLSDDDLACMSAAAVVLPVTGLSECAKAAADGEFNSFYVDAQNQCFASKLTVEDGGASCSGGGTVVYSAADPVPYFTPPQASITDFTIDDPIVGTSFTLNFEANCSAFYTFRASYGDEDLGEVRPGDVIPFDVPACSEVVLTLTPYLQGAPGDSVDATYSPVVVPTVEDFEVTDVGEDSITVKFSPVCDDYTYKLFINDNDLGEVTSPKVVTSQDSPLIKPCTTFNVTLVAQVQDGEDPYEEFATVTPSPAAGSCPFIDVVYRPRDEAQSNCPAGMAFIDSKNFLGADKTFYTDQIFWVNLMREGDVWKWGDPQKTIMPTTDPLWLSPPPTTGNAQCAIYITTMHKLMSLPCTNTVAPTYCV